MSPGDSGLMPFRRVLLAFDGSDSSRCASNAPRCSPAGQRRRSDCDHTALTSLGPEPPEAGQLDVARRVLADAYSFLEGWGVRAQAEEASGDPADRILEEARRRDVDLIVVGSRTKPLARRVLLGSVSSKVVAHAGCDVLVVR
jgi:nucleotide-binding universal stress UspA family protein